MIFPIIRICESINDTKMKEVFFMQRFKQLPVLGKILILLSVLPFIGFISLYTVVILLGKPSLSFEENTLFYDTNGTVIGVESGMENRQVVPLTEIAPTFIDALIVTEDQHFYAHHGFDFKRIAGAVISDIKSFSLKEGASTITQQYARNLYLTHDKTWSRKIKEAFYTMRLEHFYSKEEILTGYVNAIYFGHGAHGIEAASKHFFQKSAKDLTLAESAMLAGIPKGPTYYSPRNDLEKATERQHFILQLLHIEGKITAKEYTQAKNESLTLAPVQKEKRDALAPHFQDIALQEAAKLLNIPVSDVGSGGYHIYTTLDANIQQQAAQEFRETLKDGTNIEGAVLSMDPKTGGVRALIGGKSYEESHFNRAVHAKRMVGSTIKPLLYYAALKHQFTPSTKLVSEPTSFPLDEKKSYNPQNYNGYYAYKPITLAQALALSDNIYAVKTHVFIGEDQLQKIGKSFGISSDLPQVPSLALGSASISLVEMVTAYSHIANYGKKVTNHTIESITDRDGKVLYERTYSLQQIFDENKMAVLSSLLTGMFNPSFNGHMDVTGTQIAPHLSRPYAGKSGSTPYDSWMIGFSPSLVTGVWVGFDDHEPLEKTMHHTYAKKIWADVMEQIHEDEQEHFPVPKGVVQVAIDPATGLRATIHCPNATILMYEKGTEPKEYCNEHLDEDDFSPKGLFKMLFDLF